MLSVKEAASALSRRYEENYDEEVFGLHESCTEVNDASRALAEAVAASGQAWLCDVNNREYYQAKHDKNLQRAVAILWPLRLDLGEMLYNFGADYVIPCYDQELADLIRARLDTPYTGTREDADLLKRIYARIVVLGGHRLIWS